MNQLFLSQFVERNWRCCNKKFHGEQWK